MKSDKKSLSYKMKNSKFDFVKNSKYIVLVASVILFCAMFVMIFAGFNLGMDFAGGTIIDVVVEDSDKTEIYNEAQNKINEVLDSFGLSASLYQHVEKDTSQVVSVRYMNKSELTETEMEELNDDVVAALIQKFGYQNESSTMVYLSQGISAKSSSDLILNSMLAILLALIFMLIYIFIRFEFASAASAIVALMFDVLVMCSLTLIFRIEINTTFIAAIITIIGYSINNTIIIFDRMRENYRNEFYREKDKTYIANLSIKESFTRTIYTTSTTLMAIIILAIFGVDSIRQFAIPVIFGLISSMFSANFIAPTLWTLGYTKDKKRFMKEIANKEETPIEVSE